MRRMMGWTLAGVVALGLAATAFCEEPAAAAGKNSKTGVVKKVDAEAKTIVVMAARELTFTVTAETKIVQGDAAKTFADIKVGDTVTVDYTRADQDKRVATKIAIAAPAAAPAPAPAK